MILDSGERFDERLNDINLDYSRRVMVVELLTTRQEQAVIVVRVGLERDS